MNTAPTLRMPHQRAGINRSANTPAALRGTGGVEASVIGVDDALLAAALAWAVTHPQETLSAVDHLVDTVGGIFHSIGQFLGL